VAVREKQRGSRGRTKERELAQAASWDPRMYPA